MSEVHAVLLVPEEGDALGLLAEGPCGARPPVVLGWVCHPNHDAGCGHRWWAPGRLVPTCPKCGPSREPVRGTGGALALAWDGKPVAEGLDRLDRVEWRSDIRWPPTLDGLVDEYSSTRVGTLILLDADGREIEQ